MGGKYNQVQLGLKYISYFLKAGNGKGHGIHSPFVFEFITSVLNDKKAYPAYERVEELRQSLKADHTLLDVEDFGAGSSRQSSISSIAANAAKPARFGQLLHRMVLFYKPKTILELGTSLGITAAYLALGNENAAMATLEGASSVAKVARKNFSELGLQNVRLVEGEFDHTLPGEADKPGKIDFAFVDGNHRLEPTTRYYSILLSAVNNDSILVFDDIHWSQEMEQAWKWIKNHPSTRCTIDLFFIGIILFRKEFLEKQHFLIRF